MTPSRSRPVCRLLLIALAVSVTACASNCPMPNNDLLTLPPPPSSSTPEPSEKYSDSAASDTRSWQSELMATQLMRQPAAQPGQ